MLLIKKLNNICKNSCNVVTSPTLDEKSCKKEETQALGKNINELTNHITKLTDDIIEKLTF
jgi:hypothetical protein